MTPQSLLESANGIVNTARSFRNGSSRNGSSRNGRGRRGLRPVWPRQLLSLLVGAPAHAADRAETLENEAPVMMAAMGRRRRRRGRGPRPIAFPRNRRRG
ncbi:MAG: hypothetical protein AAFP03_08590 [Cyanobacteria bacterium J06598_3]